VRDGDVLRLDAETGTLEAFVDRAELASRELVDFPPDAQAWTGTGRELFAALRRAIGPADRGASVFGPIAASHFEGQFNQEVSR